MSRKSLLGSERCERVAARRCGHENKKKWSWVHPSLAPARDQGPSSFRHEAHSPRVELVIPVIVRTVLSKRTAEALGLGIILPRGRPNT